ncbi:MAG TPA: 50S ribosomal protein L23 [Candidatus Acidoferrales bacterium]|nr:50S ribosomal protein L23 [Candidatus Acidoferrales bacterium]
MSRSPVDVVYGPLVTERTYTLYQSNRYTFRVSTSATKPEIALALEEQYEGQGIKVVSVNTINVTGKARRSGQSRAKTGRTSNWKKAIVTLAPGQRLEGLFGGV